MSDIMELVASLRAPKNPSHCGSFVEVVDAGFLETIASTIERLVAERDEARNNEWPFGKRPNPVAGHTTTNFAVYGDERSIKRVGQALHELEAMAPARVERIQQEAARAQAAESRCERLEEALKPFADQADELNEASPDNRDIWENPVAMSITFGDLRRAREALEPKP